MLSEYLAIFGMIIYHYHTKGGRRFGVFVNIFVIGKQDFFCLFFTIKSVFVCPDQVSFENHILGSKSFEIHSNANMSTICITVH